MALHYTPSGRGRGPSYGHSALLLAGAVSDGSEQGDMLRDIANIRHRDSQSEACNDQSEDSSVTISPLSWYSSYLGEIQWKVPIKTPNIAPSDAYIYPFYALDGWCTRTSDIYYFFSTPFLNLYLKCIYEGMMVNERNERWLICGKSGTSSNFHEEFKCQKL